MATKITVNAIQWNNKKYPLSMIMRKPSPEFITYLNKVGKEMMEDVKADMLATNYSSTGQSPEGIKESAGYFASLLQLYVEEKPKVTTYFNITSRGDYADKYENEHGHLIKGIARRAQK